MRKYEFMIIVDEKENTFDEAKAFIKEAFGSLSIKIIDDKDLGSKELAYEINRKKRGHYYLVHAEADQTKLDDLHKKFTLYKGIMRYIKIKQDK